MKSLKTILGAVLASTCMGGAVAFAVGATNSFENSVSQIEAAGDTLSGGTKIYLAGTGDITVTGCTLNAWVWYKTGGSHWETFDSDALSGYYMITLDSDATGLTFARCSNRPGNNSSTWGDAGTVHNQTDMNFEAGKNWIWPKSWNNSVTCEWRFITYHIGGSFNGWAMKTDTYKMSDGVDGSGNHQAYIRYVATSEGTTLKAVANYNDPETIDEDNYYGTLENGVDSNYVTNDASGNIKLLYKGTYDIYLKSNRELWISPQQDVQDNYAASAWSSAFLDATGPVCGGSNDHLTGLKELWSSTTFGSLEDTNNIYIRGGVVGTWDATYKMKITATDGVVAYIVTITGNQEFKISVGTSYEESYPTNNYVLNNTGTNTYRITFNTSTHEINHAKFAFLDTSYGNLTASQKTIFKSGTLNDTVSDAKARYVVILKAYPSLSNFAGVTLNSFGLIPIQNNQVGLLIVVIAFTAISFTALFFTIIKKKRQ